MPRKRAPKAKANNEGDIEVGLIVQANGAGALRPGGKPGNNGGPGPPPSAIRAYCRGSFAQRIPVLEQIADGQLMDMTVSHKGKITEVRVKAELKDRVKAIDVLAKYGGVDKLALMPDELPSREITPERVEDMWKRLRKITSIEQLEHLMVAHAEQQLGSGDDGQP